MEDGRIKDSQITTSSVLKGRTPFGWLGRLNQNIPQWGALQHKAGNILEEENMLGLLVM